MQAWCGAAFSSKHQENASQVCVVARKRGSRGGRRGGEGAGGVDTHWQPLNTLQTPRWWRRNAGQVECRRLVWRGRGGVWARIGSLQILSIGAELFQSAA